MLALSVIASYLVNGTDSAVIVISQALSSDHFSYFGIVVNFMYKLFWALGTVSKGILDALDASLSIPLVKHLLLLNAFLAIASGIQALYQVSEGSPRVVLQRLTALLFANHNDFPLTETKNAEEYNALFKAQKTQIELELELKEVKEKLLFVNSNLPFKNRDISSDSKISLYYGDISANTSFNSTDNLLMNHNISKTAQESNNHLQEQVNKLRSELAARGNYVIKLEADRLSLLGLSETLRTQLDNLRNEINGETKNHLSVSVDEVDMLQKRLLEEAARAAEATQARDAAFLVSQQSMSEISVAQAKISLLEKEIAQLSADGAAHKAEISKLKLELDLAQENMRLSSSSFGLTLSAKDSLLAELGEKLRAAFLSISSLQTQISDITESKAEEVKVLTADLEAILSKKVEFENGLVVAVQEKENLGQRIDILTREKEYAFEQVSSFRASNDKLKLDLLLLQEQFANEKALLLEKLEVANQERESLLARLASETSNFSTQTLEANKLMVDKEHLRNEVSNLQSRVEALGEQMKELSQLLSISNSEKDIAENRAQVLDGQYKEAVFANDALTIEIAKLSESMLSQTAVSRDLMMKLSLVEQDNKRLCEECSGLHIRVNNLVNDSADLDQRIEAALAGKTMAEERALALENELTTAKNTETRLRDELALLSESARIALNDEVEAHNKLKSHSIEQLVQIEGFKRKIEDFSKDRVQLLSSIEVLESKIATFNQSQDQVLSKLGKSTSEAELVKQEFAEYKATTTLKHSTLIDELHAARRQYNDETKKLALISECRDQLMATNEQLGRELKEAQERMCELETSSNSMKNECSALRVQLAALQTYKTTLSQSLDALRDERLKEKAQFKALINQRDNEIESIKNSSHTDALNFQEQIETLQTKISGYNLIKNENDKLQETCDELKTEIRKLIHERDALILEKQDLISTANSNELKEADMREIIDALQRKIEVFVNENNTRVIEISSMKERALVSETLAESLQTDNNNLRFSVTKLKDDLNKFEENMKRAEVDHESAVATLKVQLLDSEEFTKKLQSEIDRLSLEYRNYVEENIRLVNDSSELLSDIQNKAAIIASLQSEVSAAAVLRKQMEERISTLESSSAVLKELTLQQGIELNSAKDSILSRENNAAIAVSDLEQTNSKLSFTEARLQESQSLLQSLRESHEQLSHEFKLKDCLLTEALEVNADLQEELKTVKESLADTLGKYANLTEAVAEKVDAQLLHTARLEKSNAEKQIKAANSQISLLRQESLAHCTQIIELQDQKKNNETVIISMEKDLHTLKTELDKQKSEARTVKEGLDLMVSELTQRVEMQKGTIETLHKERDVLASRVNEQESLLTHATVELEQKSKKILTLKSDQSSTKNIVESLQKELNAIKSSLEGPVNQASTTSHPSENRRTGLSRHDQLQGLLSAKESMQKQLYALQTSAVSNSDDVFTKAKPLSLREGSREIKENKANRLPLVVQRSPKRGSPHKENSFSNTLPPEVDGEEEAARRAAATLVHERAAAVKAAKKRPSSMLVSSELPVLDLKQQGPMYHRPNSPPLSSRSHSASKFREPSNKQDAGKPRHPSAR